MLRARFRTTASRVQATELAWLDRMRHAELYVYELDRAAFEEWPAVEGQWISHAVVEPHRGARSAISSICTCPPGRAALRARPHAVLGRRRVVGPAVLRGAPPIVLVPPRWHSGVMPDDGELSDINPYDLMESEAARLEFYFGSLRGDDWNEPSACEGWSVKDVLAHLAGGEEYNRACLNDNVGPMFESYAARGVTDVHSFNAIGVSDRKDKTPADLLDEFQRENGETRTKMRERDGEELSTMAGPYPMRWQAWHLASELATHADDVGVPTTHKREQETCRDWRARLRPVRAGRVEA